MIQDGFAENFEVRKQYKENTRELLTAAKLKYEMKYLQKLRENRKISNLTIDNNFNQPLETNNMNEISDDLGKDEESKRKRQKVDNIESDDNIMIFSDDDHPQRPKKILKSK